MNTRKVIFEIEHRDHGMIAGWMWSFNPSEKVEKALKGEEVFVLRSTYDDDATIVVPAKILRESVIIYKNKED